MFQSGRNGYKKVHIMPAEDPTLNLTLNPGGAQLVFRSGRDGYKNLYIMPAEGEGKGLTRLTEGPWDDTMPGWTPASGWIVFASSRAYDSVANRPAGAFDIWMVRPIYSHLWF